MNLRLLLGGSFDPPHQGHLAMAEAAAQFYKVPAVTFVPNFVNPFKDRSMSAEQRVEMLELCLPEGSEILRYEIEKEEPSYTIDTLRYLKSQCDDELIWLIGADCLASLHQWKEVAEVVKLARFQVITRPNSDLLLTENLKRVVGEDAQSLIDHVIELDMPYSSSQIRQEIREGKEVKGLDDKVLVYIREKGLYLS